MKEDIGGKAIILILIIIVGLIIYQIFFAEAKNCPACNCTVQSETKECKECFNNNQQPIVVNVHQDDELRVPVIPPARLYDYKTFNDPLVPPYKRDDYDVFFPPGAVDKYHPIATRGYPTAFKKMGLLNDQSSPNDDKYKFMVIMGRQTYPNSNYYDYYVTENKEESSLKFDLKDLHKELNDGDTITIPDLGKTYTVKLDRNLGFRYTPFVF